MKGRIIKTAALLGALLLGGCMLPRMFVAAFIPFQRFMIWGAAMAARYGAPLVMLMFVDASPSAAPRLSPEGYAEPLVCEERLGAEELENRDLAKVFIIDYRRMGESDYAALLREAARGGQLVTLAPVGGREEALLMAEALRSRGVELQLGIGDGAVNMHDPEGEL